ncbi:S8/S53 family peptidase [Bacillus tianshenii]|nr:S8/S53 family peptidase [Bacillus tianshenii]
MTKFNVRLNQEYNKGIQQILQSNNIKVKHFDAILNDFIIVETNDKDELYEFDFIKSIKETRIGRLLDLPKNQKTVHLKVKPTPELNLKPLRDKGLYGLGTKIAVIDSGYDIERVGEVECAMNFTNHPNSYDTCGHGSIVIGQILNIISKAKIYSAKVCIRDNDIDEEDVFRALDWVTTLSDVKVINLSLGMDAKCQGDCDLADKINAMEKMGYIIVAAMGNNGSYTHCPACAENAISVGALDKTGKTVACYSSQGHINSNKPDLVAQGHGVETFLGVNHDFQGTSFAAPIVTGLLGATYNMFKENKEVKQYLISSCEPLINVPRTKQGYGKIDLEKFLEEIT